MPKPGFTSITIGDVVYDKWHDFYTSRKDNFRLIGINSISALISVILESVSKMDGQRLTEIIQTREDGKSS